MVKYLPSRATTIGLVVREPKRAMLFVRLADAEIDYAGRVLKTQKHHARWEYIANHFGKDWVTPAIEFGKLHDAPRVHLLTDGTRIDEVEDVPDWVMIGEDTARAMWGANDQKAGEDHQRAEDARVLAAYREIEKRGFVGRLWGRLWGIPGPRDDRGWGYC
jgi:hypothetical protein